MKFVLMYYMYFNYSSVCEYTVEYKTYYSDTEGGGEGGEGGWGVGP